MAKEIIISIPTVFVCPLFALQTLDPNGSRLACLITVPTTNTKVFLCGNNFFPYRGYFLSFSKINFFDHRAFLGRLCRDCRRSCRQKVAFGCVSQNSTPTFLSTIICLFSWRSFWKGVNFCGLKSVGSMTSGNT